MYDFREVQEQFGSFDLGGIAVGSGGIGPFAGGLRGSIIAPGLGAASGSIGPLIVLEELVGLGFSAQDVADRIRFLEQEGLLGPSGGEGTPGIIQVLTSVVGNVFFQTLAGIFTVTNARGQTVGTGATVGEALANVPPGSGPTPADVGLGGGAAQEPPPFPVIPSPLEAVVAQPFVAPAPPPQQDPNLFGAIQALISLLRPPPTFQEIIFGPPRRTPAPSDFPIDFPPELQPFPDVFGFPPDFDPGFPPIRPVPIEVQQQEQVLPGGTVNVPVVLGSTGDPTGVRRPRFPDEEQLSRAQQIGRLIHWFLQLRKARQTQDKQRRAIERFLADRLALLRRAQMPFGQSQFVGPGAGALLPGIGGIIGGLLPDLIGRLFPGDQPGFPSLPSFPTTGLPTQGPGLFPMPGGGGACPPLFRGAPATFRMSPVPWFPVQAPNGKWFFFGHLGTPTFSKLKGRRRHHHHARKR